MSVVISRIALYYRDGKKLTCNSMDAQREAARRLIQLRLGSEYMGRRA